MTEFLRRRGLILATLFALSVLPHLKGITSPMLDYHYHRQCNTAAIARNYSENGLRFFTPQLDWEGNYRGRGATEFPLYMYLIGLLWPLGGLGDMWGRILAILFSAGTAMVLFLLLDRKVEREAAFLGSALFCFIPLEIYFGRTVQPEAIALLTTTASLYFWDRSLEPERRLGFWGAAILLAFLGISHKLPYAFILGPLAYLSWRRLGLSGALTDARTLSAPVLALGLTYAWYKYASYGAYVVPSNPNEFMSLLDYSRSLYYIWFQFGSRFPELSATYGGVVLIAIGALELRRRRGKDADYLPGAPRDPLFFAAWWGSVAGSLILGGAYTFQHEYTSLPFTPVNGALMGVGLWTLWKKSHEASETDGRRLRALAVVLALAVPVHAAFRIKHWYKVNFQFLKDAQKAADAVSAPDDLFLCNERGSSVYLYYMHRRGWSWDMAEAGEKRLGEIDGKIAAGAKYYFTDNKPYLQDKTSPYARYLAKFPLIYDKDGILIFRLWPEPKKASPARHARS